MASATRSRRDRDTSTASKPKPSADAYVGILAISLLLQITAGVFLWLDYSQYPTTTPPETAGLGYCRAVQPQLPPGGGVPAPPPGGGGAVAPAGGAEKAGGAP